MSAAQLKIDIVADKFNAMLRELSDLAIGVEFRDVVRSEAAGVVRSALAFTKAAEAGRIRATHATKEWTTFNGKRYHFAEWRLPNSIWAGIQQKRAEQLQTKLNSRGLSKQSWLQVGLALSKKIDAPAYVVAASYKGRRYPEDGEENEDSTGTNYALTIINSSPIVQAAGGTAALLRGMTGRVRYFERNLAHHAFKSLADRAKKYPGIWTEAVPPPAVEMN